MFPIKIVLCPTDFSNPSSEALRIAAEIASKVGAGLLLVHAVPVLPALPNDPNYVFKVPEYEKVVASRRRLEPDSAGQGMANAGTQARTMVGHGEMRRARLCASPTRKKPI